MRSIHTAAFLFFLLLLPLSLRATALAGDVIYMDGERWNLLWKPIYEDSALAKRLMEFLPEERMFSTADIHGFTAHWIIKDGCLYLQKIEICRLDQGKEPLFFDADELKEIFAPYYEHGRIRARWLSGELRAGRGKTIRNEMLGFDRNYEEECVMKVKRGKITGKRVYRNFKKEGAKIYSMQLTSDSPFARYLELKSGDNELWLSRFKMQPDGRFIDCHVEIYLNDGQEVIKKQSHPAIKAFKDYLRSVCPWEIFYINGECRMRDPFFRFVFQ